jgi:hypothetical protein
LVQNSKFFLLKDALKFFNYVSFNSESNMSSDHNSDEDELILVETEEVNPTTAQVCDERRTDCLFLAFSQPQMMPLSFSNWRHTITRSQFFKLSKEILEILKDQRSSLDNFEPLTGLSPDHKRLLSSRYKDLFWPSKKFKEQAQDLEKKCFLNYFWSLRREGGRGIVKREPGDTDSSRESYERWCKFLRACDKLAPNLTLAIEALSEISAANEKLPPNCDKHLRNLEFAAMMTDNSKPRVDLEIFSPSHFYKSQTALYLISPLVAITLISACPPNRKYLGTIDPGNLYSSFKTNKELMAKVSKQLYLISRSPNFANSDANQLANVPRPSAHDFPKAERKNNKRKHDAISKKEN